MNENNQNNQNTPNNQEIFTENPIPKKQNDLIERYIYDVARRLPENEQSEVKLELRANIADMLPESPSLQDTKNILQTLGSPIKLANQYRQKPQYLISPLLYDTYIQTLKLVASIVAAVAAVGGAISGIPHIGAILSTAVWAGLQGALQAAFWVTIGFVIAEKSGYTGEDWKVENLPPLPAATDVSISKISSILGIALSAVFTVGGIYWLLSGGTFLFMINFGQENISLFSEAALQRAVPFVAIIGVAGIISNLVKLRHAKWNIPVCLTNAAFNIIVAASMITVLFWQDLFNPTLPAHPVIGDAISDVIVAMGQFQWRHIIAVLVIGFSLWDIVSGGWQTAKGLLRVKK